MHNSIGECFCVTTFGESHGKIIGVVIDGCPSGIKITQAEIQNEMNKRRPGILLISTKRSETDKIEILSGIKNEYTTGAPIAIMIHNEDFNSVTYTQVKTTPRPSHADYPALERFGKSVDLNGGGRFSGRITASFVMAGAIAEKILFERGIKVAAYASSIGEYMDNKNYTLAEIKRTENPFQLPNSLLVKKVETLILDAKSKKDSVGGIVKCIIEGVPPGMGNPLFGSVESKLSTAIFAIPGIRGIEFGLGFASTKLPGSLHNDAYSISNGKIITKSNNAGGIIGGLTTGMPIVFSCAVKPTPTIGISQETIDLETQQPVKIAFKGDHDPCIVPRIIPVIESITAIVLVDILIGNGWIPQKIEK